MNYNKIILWAVVFLVCSSFGYAAGGLDSAFDGCEGLNTGSGSNSKGVILFDGFDGTGTIQNHAANISKEEWFVGQVGATGVVDGAYIDNSQLATPNDNSGGFLNLTSYHNGNKTIYTRFRRANMAALAISRINCINGYSDSNNYLGGYWHGGAAAPPEKYWAGGYQVTEVTNNMPGFETWYYAIIEIIDGTDKRNIWLYDDDGNSLNTPTTLDFITGGQVSTIMLQAQYINYSMVLVVNGSKGDLLALNQSCSVSALTITNQVNATSDGFNYTFGATSSANANCILYGNWNNATGGIPATYNGTWEAKENKSATAATPFNFTSVLFGIGSYGWNVFCDDGSNTAWGTNTTFIVNSQLNKTITHQLYVNESANTTLYLNLTYSTVLLQNVTGVSLNYNGTAYSPDTNTTTVNGNTTNVIYSKLLTTPIFEINNTLLTFTWSWTEQYVGYTNPDSVQGNQTVYWLYYPTTITLGNTSMIETETQSVICNWSGISSCPGCNFSISEYVNVTNHSFTHYYTGLGAYEYATPSTDYSNTTNQVYCTLNVGGYNRTLTTNYTNYNFAFGLCTADNPNSFLAFYSYDEKTKASITSDIQINIRYMWGTQSSWLGYNGTGQNNYTFCATPTFVNFVFNSTSLHLKSDYATRSYYYNGETITDGYEEIPIYLLNDTFATDLVVTVYDSDLNEVDDAFVKLLRYDLATDSYSTVQIENTVAGIVHLDLELDTFYKIMIEYGGVLKKETSPFKYTSDSVYYVINLEEDFLEGFKYLDDIATLLEWDNDTLTFRYTWSAADGKVQYGCLEVYRESEIYGETLLDSDCETSNSATVYVTLPSLTDGYTYRARGLIDTTTAYSVFITDIIEFTTNTGHKMFGADGVLATVLLIIGLGGILAFDGALMIIGSLLGLISAAIFGIIYLPIGIILGVVVLGAILIGLMRK